MLDINVREKSQEVKNLMNGHQVKWNQVEGNRRVLYIPFSKEEIDAPFRQPGNPGHDAGQEQGEGEDHDQDLAPFMEETDEKLDEMTNTLADSIMLRTFIRGVETHMADKTTVLNGMNLMSEWGKLNEGQQNEVLNEVVRKTPAIIVGSQAPTHGGQPLPQGQGPLNLRPDDSIHVTGHGHRTMDFLGVVAKLDVGKELSAPEAVQRLKQDLMQSDLAVPLDDPALAPKVKLNSCGSGGNFHMAFAEAAKDAKLPVEVYAFDHDSISFQAVETAFSDLQRSDRYLVSSEQNNVAELLRDAASAASTLSTAGHGDKTLEELAALQEDQEAALVDYQAMLEFHQGDLAQLPPKFKGTSYETDILEQIQDAQQSIQQEEARLPGPAREAVTALTKLQKHLATHDPVQGMTAAGLTKAPLGGLNAPLKAAAEQQHKDSRHRPSLNSNVISVKEAMGYGAGGVQGQEQKLTAKPRPGRLPGVNH